MSENWIEGLGEAGIRAGLAVLTLALGLLVAVIARAVIRRLLERRRVARRIGPSMRHFISRAAYFALLLLTVVVVLHVLGIPDRVILVGLAITAAILVLALRQSLANFATTVVFLIFQPFKLGDEIETMGVRGTVEDIQLFNTVIKLFDHSIASLPNANIQESGVINYTKSGILWATMTLTIGYDQDLARVRRVIGEVLEADPRVLDDPAWEVIVLRLAPEGTVLEIHPTVDQRDFWPMLDELQGAIVIELKAAGIPIAVAPETQVRMLGDPSGATREKDE